jgi:acetoin:2,6-dichlorophenolindophenol oxidoreductase subunit alpha
MSFDKAKQREALRRMLSIRRFEEEGTRLFKEGRIPGAFHASIGQEAAIVGACMALRSDDMMTGTHRSHGHPIGKGADLKALMAELMGKQTGICKGRGGSMHLADNSVGIIGESAIVGGGIPLATGCGLSAKVRGTDQVSLCFFGDGAVNQGTFHESLNMASLWKLPVIYLCENNGYAITTSLARSHGQTSIARRADAYGMPGTVVDGQDVQAVYEATAAAVSCARLGEGPTLIEAKTYRFDEHNVGLYVRVPYRPTEEVEEYRRRRDPLVLFRTTLAANGFGEAELSEIAAEVEAAVAAAVRFAEESAAPDPQALYHYLYSNPIEAFSGRSAMDYQGARDHVSSG